MLALPTAQRINETDETRYNFHFRENEIDLHAYAADFRPTYLLTYLPTHQHGRRDSRVSSSIDLLIQSVPFHQIYSLPSPITRRYF